MGAGSLRASNILQELLTVKSDDIIGRAKDLHESIVKGEKPAHAEHFLNRSTC